MIKVIVLGFSIIGIVIFTILTFYAVLSIFIARGFMDNEKNKH